VAASRNDTVAGKVSRFVFGAVGGAVSGWLYTAGTARSEGRIGTVAVFAVIGGVMALLLGGLLLKRGRR
jgi:uncharacterized membrane protein YeaQ/YmgE (transglycosylase-associated protein family)